ncbi:hypothetical protein [Ochrobactrum sp. S1502_03]|uniref:hypothetical protein n=1 Tax=Ochrobactrum sp. S1502_03 TaxID=3108451 RepID=UPI0037CAFED0
MNNTFKAPAQFTNLVRKAIKDGQDGRNEIIGNMAAMPLEKLARVPASTLALLGPAGLAELARRRTDVAGLAPKSLVAPVPAVQNQNDKKGKRAGRIPFGSTLWLSGGVIIVALSFVSASTLWQKWGNHGSLSRSADQWPRCDRLSHHTDGCVYYTGGNQLTLEQAALYLAQDLGQMQKMNRHIVGSPQQPIAEKTPLIVLRDTSRLMRRSK